MDQRVLVKRIMRALRAQDKRDVMYRVGKLMEHNRRMVAQAKN